MPLIAQKKNTVAKGLVLVPSHFTCYIAAHFINLIFLCKQLNGNKHVLQASY